MSGKEKTLGRPYSSLSILKGGLQEDGNKLLVGLLATGQGIMILN